MPSSKTGAAEYNFIVGVIPKETLGGQGPTNPSVGMTLTKMFSHDMSKMSRGVYCNKLLGATNGGGCQQLLLAHCSMFFMCNATLLFNTGCMRISDMTQITRKQTLRSLSLSYQKKDGRAWPHPSFFWYDTNF